MTKSTYTFKETVVELGYKPNGSGLSQLLLSCDIHVARDKLLPTDGNKNRIFTAEQVAALKAVGHERGAKLTQKQRRAIRQVFYGKPVQKDDTAPVETVSAVVTMPDAEVVVVPVAEKKLTATEKAILALAAGATCSLPKNLCWKPSNMTKAELRATYHLALAYAAVAVFIAFNVYDRAQINAHGRDLARAEAVVLAALMDAPVVVEPPMLEPPLLVGGR